MEVDYCKAWLEMKEVVLSRRSHGQDGLLGEMTRIELRCRVPEGQEMFSDLQQLAPSGKAPPVRAGGANGDHANTH